MATKCNINHQYHINFSDTLSPCFCIWYVFHCSDRHTFLSNRDKAWLIFLSHNALPTRGWLNLRGACFSCKPAGPSAVMGRAVLWLICAGSCWASGLHMKAVSLMCAGHRRWIGGSFSTLYPSNLTVKAWGCGMSFSQGCGFWETDWAFL